MNEMIIKNTGDGKEVAVAIGFYINSFSTPAKLFYECMLKEKKNIQHNFTILCFEWLNKLSTVTYYDDRNKASVELARVISSEMHCDDLSKVKTSASGTRKSMSFDYRSDESAVTLMNYYLRLSENNDNFISQMLTEHRTNQQSFTRVCMRWIQEASILQGKSRYILLAKKANKYYRYLPMI